MEGFCFEGVFKEEEGGGEGESEREKSERGEDSDLWGREEGEEKGLGAFLEEEELSKRLRKMKKIKPRRRKNTVIGRRRDLAMVNLLSFKLLNAKIH